MQYDTDILVVGAGVNGAGIARDAAGRGLIQAKGRRTVQRRRNQVPPEDRVGGLQMLPIRWFEPNSKAI